MLIGIARPFMSRRKPVSMGCWTSTRTSKASPLRTVDGTWRRPISISDRRLVEAGGRGDEHLEVAQPVASARQGREDRDLLRAREPDARGDLGARRLRAEV